LDLFFFTFFLPVSLVFFAPVRKVLLISLSAAFGFDFLR
jgi:hypothetical protein